MKFAQRLTCVMLLVLAFSFSAGGCIYLYGEFAERLSDTTAQNQSQHSLLCRSMEENLLTLHRQGTAVTDVRITGYAAGLQSDSPPDCFLSLSRGGAALYGTLPAGLDGSALANGQMLYARRDGKVYALYRSDLLDGVTLCTAFSVTALYDGRARSTARFILMEAVVLVCAALVISQTSKRLTRPLSLLNDASRRIAAGAYDQRTGIRREDEIGELSESFDHMAAAVQEKVQALELSVRQRDDFMGAFTHELKTPMTSIIGYADMLRTLQCDPAEQQEAAEAIFHEAKRLESLSLKLLSLLGLDEEPLTLKPTSMAEVLQTVRRSAGQVCTARGVTLQLPDCACTVQGDADLLADLLYNLIHNAAKASAAGSTVRVLAEPAGDGLRLTVADQGCGIPPEAVARVTEPFYMVDKSRARKSGGSGLGLALCQRIARAHGGQLTVESELGRGTRVSVTIPLAGEANA